MQGVKCTREIKASIPMAISAFNKKTLSTNKLDFIVRKNLVQIYFGSTDFYSA